MPERALGVNKRWAGYARRVSRLLWVSVAALLLLGPGAGAAPLPPNAPHLRLELESQALQPGGPGTRAFGLGAALVFRMSDQVSLVGSASGLGGPGGPVTTAGLGLRALLDATPLAPFVDLQALLLGPVVRTGYQYATRIGGGADYHLSEALAVGLAVRTITSFDPGGAGTTGFEVALRLSLTPSLLR